MSDTQINKNRPRYNPRAGKPAKVPPPRKPGEKECFVQVAGSLENYAAIELQELGARILRSVPRGVYISASPETMYRIVYESRLAQRLLYPLLIFDCHSENYLYQQARKSIDWTRIFKPEESFAIEANVSSSNIRHSLYASQLLKDAICDQFREAFGKRPDFDPKEPDLVLSLHVHQNKAQISLDLGGGSLHKRGYRVSAGAAPLQETLAAVIIRASGWQGEEPLVDPMCGSGTLLAEALMHYCRIPAAYLRSKFGLKYLPDFDSQLWEDVRKRADRAIRPLPEGLIRGSDISAANLEIATGNLSRLPYGGEILLKTADFNKLKAYNGLFIVTNPPYGIRIGEGGTIATLYNELGTWLRSQCTGSTAVILCGSSELASELKLRHRWLKNLKNGDLDTVLGKFLLR
ncbi:MAG: THUMP domain-containing protein [Candidatus Cloacimonadota bacterium]